MKYRTPPRLQAWGLRAAAALLAAALAGPAAAADACGTEEEQPVELLPADAQAAAAARRELQALLAQAEARSAAVGAARLLAEAAQSDLEEARAAPLPRATLSSSALANGQRVAGLQRNGSQARADLNVSAPLWDAGYSAALADWRARLLDAARLGELDTREQVALQTLSSALEQQRYGLQARVYERYTARMGCLVGALEQIVAADRGRASELLQARNTQRQAELALAQARSQQRQAEIRLRRFIGDASLPTAPLQLLLQQPPPLQRALDEAARASAVAQLTAQAEAQRELTRALRAQRQPQWSWSVGGTQLAGSGGASTVWSGGISVSVPLLDPTAQPAIRASAQRGEAAVAQRDEALSQRLERVAGLHEQADAAFERALRSAEVLQVSQRLRQATRLQWQQLGRRSLFDVISTEGDFHNLQVTRINALLDAQQATALLWSLGTGVAAGVEASALPAPPAVR
ncbi:TolC family protein [Azohydromonas aeria]|uniref:TolC family protein n=1 Tax=Azohydromonas aeria TaxID=2590212 RepID=UPI0012F9E0EE|nr:TolC family protein [Azohydromonas aeria]